MLEVKGEIFVRMNWVSWSWTDGKAWGGHLLRKCPSSLVTPCHFYRDCWVYISHTLFLSFSQYLHKKFLHSLKSSFPPHLLLHVILMVSVKVTSFTSLTHSVLASKVPIISLKFSFPSRPLPRVTLMVTIQVTSFKSTQAYINNIHHFFETSLSFSLSTCLSPWWWLTSKDIIFFLILLSYPPATPCTLMPTVKVTSFRPFSLSLTQSLHQRYPQFFETL